MHTALLLKWGLSAFLRRRGKRYLTPIVRFQQDSVYVQSPSLRYPCQQGFSERCLVAVLSALAVERRRVCSGTVAISGGGSGFAFLSACPYQSTSVWTVRE